MFRYKNVSESDITLVGFGVIKANQEFTTGREVNHAGIKLVSEDANEVVGTAQEQPNGVTEATPVAEEEIEKVKSEQGEQK